ncbi:MAG: Multi-sensor signal transduction histidine kinase [Candidatus Daviesbacteria bacterium GW2011_GWA1_41_61]|uniref:histidine kinase n=1 Tax=Candidatus Daviesbacteria bacterium GW2011_GWA2_40_9 TaxID=1618424 RepID=A0A0G0X4W5_9BACT|nr:MAG: Multi-sensor hybrid histidine kinase [Candidatus Daviesbacteria bacterium GW2011_GWC1_40_9]KKR82657.1 MAG: Multi-sensor signal transduction histidine kinase [Candidatus Daviesbacteria bacterium GW2011_GWA2_40_9]KKR93388.1 MAG: Multi-sensor signal transduction histidine kinase [Candidatus Daviesbacteria bacterium GW2011_GWB1_41_15]KKS15063.1 MAG: Multi-sensor signal transduction histidine kinase [Candidatus Daviesbacteria bacterium GW2011_GWA1_41_61]
MPRLRLRFKFILLLLSLAVIPLLLVSILNIYNLQKAEKNNSLNLENKVAQLVTEQVKSFISMQLSVLKGIDTTFSHLLTKQLKDEFMDIFLFKNPNFVDIAILDKTGNEIIHKNAIKIFDEKDLTNRKNSPEFAQIEKSRYFIGSLYFENGIPYMQIGRQLLDHDGQFSGAIIGVIDVRIFQDVVKEIASSNNSQVYIVDQNGVVVAHSDISVVLAQKNYSKIPAIDKIINHNEEINSLDLYTNDQNQQVIGLAFPIKLNIDLVSNEILDTRLIAVSEQLGSVALYPVEQITRFSSVALILVILSSIFMTLIYSNIIISPIEKVHMAAKKLGLGDFEARVSINTKDEIEDLANSFNQMAGSLKKSIFNLEQDRQLIAAERNKLQVVLSGISDAVIAVDLQWQIILVNKAALTLTGLAAKQLLGNKLTTVVKVEDSENQIIPITSYCPIRTDNFEGVTFNQDKLKVITAKREFVANLIASQIKEGPKVNMGGILTFHDVSEQSQLEEMKLDFVSMAAHELRTPLTSIKGYLHIFLRDYAKSMDPEQTSILSRIGISTQKLVSLVENLLNVSRIEKGDLTLSLLPLDWVKNIYEVVAEIINQANDKKITLEFIKPQQSSINVIADKFRINEVLTNLLANAITYTSPGGKITVWLERKGNEVITHIQDTGEGIPKDALPHLFTKFFRVSGTLEQGSKGTGLGLYIAKSVVQLHKGKIWVNSELGKGSTFSFSLHCTNS